jgi:hypothetical protein
MRQLSGEIARLRQMAELSKNPPFNELSEQILKQADSSETEIVVPGDLLLLGSIILRAGENMLRLMAALHHWMATGELTAPQIDGASFETESLRRLQHEAAEARDVATWLRYPVIADLLTGDSTASGEDRAAAAIAFPTLGAESYQAAVRRLAEDAMRVFYQNTGETPAR